MRGLWLLVAFALLLTAALAMPVLEAPSERLIGSEIVGRHVDAYMLVLLFERPTPLHPRSQPVTDWVGAAIARFTGGVAAYNLLVLATFPLAVLLAYPLARHFSIPPLPAALAALAFGFAPSHLAHAAYHPHIVQVQWIPLYLLALFRCLDRWSPWRALALIGAGALLVLSNLYNGLFAALLTPVALVAYRPASAAEGGRSGRVPTVLTLGAGVTAGLVWIWVAARQILSQPAAFVFSIADVQRYSARWFSYLLPPVEHPLAGDRVAEFWRRREIAGGLIEQQIPLGLALVALAAVAVVAWRRGSAEGIGARGMPLFLAEGTAAFVASLAPASTAGPWPAPAVSTMVREVVPMFRAYARLGIWAELLIALMAAVGFAVLWRGGRSQRIAALVLTAVAAVEYAPFPPWRWHHVLPTEGHRWMADQPGEWRLLDCAKEPPFVAISIGWFLPRITEQLSPVVPDCAEPDLPGKLAALGFTHVLLRPGTPEDRWYAERAPPDGLVEERRFTDSRVLRVASAPAPIHVGHWVGFSWREYGADRSYRWLGASGEWWVINNGERPLDAVLEVELTSFPGERGLAPALDGVPLERLRVTARPVRYRLGPMRLPAGRSRLEWRPEGPPAIPAEILGSGDRRELTVAIGGWRWEVLVRPDG